MAEINQKEKRVPAKVTLNVENLAGLSIDVIKQDIEHLMFVEHELPMEEYTKLLEMVDGLAKLVVIHADAAVRQEVHALTSRIGERFKSELGDMVYGEKPKMTETVEIKTNISALMGEQS